MFAAGAIGPLPTLDPAESRVLVAQGMGITPFLAMAGSHGTLNATLLQVGARNYFDEVAAATRGNAEHHDHREGPQDAVRKAIVNRPAARWLLSGRPDFAAAVATQLADAAMPGRMIHKDKFWGMQPPAPATTSSPPERRPGRVQPNSVHSGPGQGARDSEAERRPAMTTVNTTLGSLYVDDRGQPDEPAALLWPSLFTDHRMWRHQIAPLREAGWRTLALDPPGHGRSPGPGRGFTMDECAQAAVQVLDATDVRAPAAVLGTSWGGFVAPRIAVLAPERLSGMALFNTSAERGTPFERAKATLLTKLLAMGALDKVTARMIVSGLLAPETQRREPELGGELAEQFLAWDRRRFIATVRSVLVDRDPVLGALPELKVPALIVSGKEDHTLPSFHSQRMAQKLSDARHVEVSGAAHLVPLEAPHRANPLILDFLRDLTRA